MFDHLVSKDDYNRFWGLIHAHDSWEAEASNAASHLWLAIVGSDRSVVIPPQARAMKDALQGRDYPRIGSTTLDCLKPFTDEPGWGVFAKFVLPLIAKKQHDYGHDNIELSGIDGVRVRIIDKWARYENLRSRAKHPSTTDASALNEPIVDTLIDILGYLVIAVMLDEGTFGRPLAADMEPTDGADTPEGQEERAAAYFDACAEEHAQAEEHAAALDVQAAVLMELQALLSSLWVRHGQGELVVVAAE